MIFHFLGIVGVSLGLGGNDWNNYDAGNTLYKICPQSSISSEVALMSFSFSRSINQYIERKEKKDRKKSRKKEKWQKERKVTKKEREREKERKEIGSDEVAWCSELQIVTQIYIWHVL